MELDGHRLIRMIRLNGDIAEQRRRRSRRRGSVVFANSNNLLRVDRVGEAASRPPVVAMMARRASRRTGRKPAPRRPRARLRILPHRCVGDERRLPDKMRAIASPIMPTPAAARSEVPGRPCDAPPDASAVRRRSDPDTLAVRRKTAIAARNRADNADAAPAPEWRSRRQLVSRDGDDLNTNCRCGRAGAHSRSQSGIDRDATPITVSACRHAGLDHARDLVAERQRQRAILR